MFISTFLISFLITLYLTPKILLVSIQKRLIDKPNERKVHTCTSSRLGGVAFFPSILISSGIVAAIYSLIDPTIWSEIVTAKFILGACAALILCIVGIADDVVGVKYRKKFLFQILSGILIIISGIWVNNLYGLFGVYELSAWIGMPLTLFIIILIINALNLIDGIDGLASGLSIIASLFFGIYFMQKGVTSCALISFATLGALVAFFKYNVFGVSNKKYKIFMGDTGSLVIGCILSILAIYLCQYQEGTDLSESTNDFILAYSLLIVPCFDVARIVFHRYRNKKPLFSPDKNHIHHKFIALGMSHRKALVSILSISFLFTFMNLALYQFININFVVAIDIIIWTLFHLFLSRMVKMKNRAK